MLAAIAVAAGAFGAHALRAQLSAQDTETWRTAANYLLIHGVALVAIGLHGSGGLKIPGVLLLCGCVMFSSSLFILVLANARWLGAVTPIGGALMIAGWVLAALALSRGTIRK